MYHACILRQLSSVQVKFNQVLKSSVHRSALDAVQADLLSVLAWSLYCKVF